MNRFEVEDIASGMVAARGFKVPPRAISALFQWRGDRVGAWSVWVTLHELEGWDPDHCCVEVTDATGEARFRDVI